MRYKGCYFHAENNKVTLAYPNCIIAVDTEPELQVTLTPAKDSRDKFEFDETEAILHHQTKRRKYTTIPSSQTKCLQLSEYHQFTDEIRVKKLIPEAKLPRRATSGSVGFDVQSSQVTVIPAMSQAIVHTGLAMAVPTGMYLRIAPRSSLSMKGINVGAGVVDNDFRGEIKVVLQNTTSKPFTVPFHSSVAQFIFEKNAIPCLTVCNNLSQTSRGPGGFGSSNTKPKDLHFINRLKAKTAALRATTKRHGIQLVNISDRSDGVEDTCLHTSVPPVDVTNKKSSGPNATVHPPILPENSVNHSLPKTATFSQDYLAQSTGFYNNNNFIKYVPTVRDNNVNIKQHDGPPLSDEGYSATLRSRRRNTSPSKTSYAYSDVWHMDIGYGPTTAIGGIRYSLMLIDKATKLRRMYPLKNMTTSIPRAIKKFLNDVGTKPRIIRTDFDSKFLGAETRDILDTNQIRVEAAPPQKDSIKMV